MTSPHLFFAKQLCTFQILLSFVLGAVACEESDPPEEGDAGAQDAGGADMGRVDLGGDDLSTAKRDMKSAVDASVLDGSSLEPDSGGAGLDMTTMVDMSQGFGDMATVPKSACFAIFGRACGELESGTLVSADGTLKDDLFKVAIDGDLMAVLVSDPPMGAVNLYKREPGGNWVQSARLKPTKGGGIGTSIALDGDTIVVGAQYESTCLSGVNPTGDDKLFICESRGAAYTFERDPTTDQWAESAYIKPTTSGGDFVLFGSSVQVDGDTIVVSASSDSNCAEGINQGSGEDYNCFAAGSVYVYQRDVVTKEWQEAFYIKPSFPRKETRFGEVIALDGDVLAVTAIFDDGCVGGVNPTQIFNDGVCGNVGAVYLFTRATQTKMWEQTAYIKASTPEAEDRFGHTLALDKDTLAVGAVEEDSCRGAGEEDNSCRDLGAVYIFEKKSMTNMWEQTFFLKTPPTSTNSGIVYQLHDGVLATYSAENKLCPVGLNLPGKVEDATCEARGGVDFFRRSTDRMSWNHVGYAKSPAPTRFKTIFGNTFLSDEGLTIVQLKNRECKDGMIVPRGEFRPVPCSQESEVFTYPFLP